GRIADAYAIDETAFHVGVVPFSGRFPVLDRTYGEHIAQEFQAKFLSYRCHYVLDVRTSSFGHAEFISGARVLVRVLGAPIIDAPALQVGLISLVRQHDQNRRAFQWTDLQSVVIGAVIHHVHKEPGTWVHVRKITKTVIGILKLRQDATEPKPREIGPILKSFGLLAERDNRGWAILLTSARCRGMHELARQYGVLAKREGKPPCSYCDAIFGSRE